MQCSYGDVIWLRTDNLEGGLGRLHPAIVISSNEFNDSHPFGIIVRGSSDVPQDPDPYEYVVKPTRGNGLDKETVFYPIVQTAVWERVNKKVGEVPPYQLKQVLARIRRILDL